MKLKKSIKAKWVKALRSGKYEQGQGSLRVDREIVDKDGFATLKTKKHYCCLGVACAIGITQPRREDGLRSSGWVSNNFLPSEIQKTLANMNDDGDGFKKIASWISKKL